MNNPNNFLGSADPGDDDDDEDDRLSVARTTTSRKSRSTRYEDSDDDLDDISPHDSISNAGGLKVSSFPVANRALTARVRRTSQAFKLVSSSTY